MSSIYKRISTIILFFIYINASAEITEQEQKLVINEHFFNFNEYNFKNIKEIKRIKYYFESDNSDSAQTLFYKNNKFSNTDSKKDIEFLLCEEILLRNDLNTKLKRNVNLSKALRLIKDTSELANYVRILNGYSFIDRSMLDSASFCFEKLINTKWNKEATLALLKIYLEKNELKKAKKLYEVFKVIIKDKKLEKSESLILQNFLVTLSYIERNFEKCNVHLDSLIKICNKEKLYNLTSEAYRLKSNIAFHDNLNKDYLRYRDSANHYNKLKLIRESEQNYPRYTFRETERRRISNQAKVDQLEIDKQKERKFLINVSIASILIISFLILIISIINNLKRKLKDANTSLIAKNEEITLINKEMNESLEMAKLLQGSILTLNKVIGSYIEKSFVIYLPKIAVAGDFYWMQQKNDLICVAACDCTGHGIPGALLSMMCHNALNEVFNHNKFKTAADFLEQVDDYLKIRFPGTNDNTSALAHGMDVSLVFFTADGKSVNWVGAQRPLYIIDNLGNYKKINGSKRSIGEKNSNVSFKDEHITLKKGESIYLFTDGLPDQFGGQSKRKLMPGGFRNILFAAAQLGMEEKKAFILNEIKKYQGQAEQTDDITIIGIEI
jgi:serine phosphatase RsbU (regulator of sigma subunit)